MNKGIILAILLTFSDIASADQMSLMRERILLARQDISTIARSHDVWKYYKQMTGYYKLCKTGRFNRLREFLVANDKYNKAYEAFLIQ